jgi:hypothetical protein
VLVLGGFGVANQKHRLSSVLPELICFRHARTPVPRHPRLHSLAVCMIKVRERAI